MNALPESFSPFSIMFMTKDIHAVGPKGRTEKNMPLIRETLGDEMALYADANGFYSVDEVIRVGKLLEEYDYGFFEEPVPFDWYEETKQVTDTLTLPIAGGEQEYSLHGFRWLIANDGLVSGNRLDCDPGLELPAMLPSLCHNSFLSDATIPQPNYLIHWSEKPGVL